MKALKTSTYKNVQQIDYKKLFFQIDTSGIRRRARKDPEEKMEMDHRIDLFTKWAKSRGIYKESQASAKWPAVLGKRTHGAHGGYGEDVSGIHVFDHRSLFLTKDHGKILTSHTYTEYTNEEKEIIKKWGEERSLAILIHPMSESWYYPGRTSFIEIIKADLL